MDKLHINGHTEQWCLSNYNPQLFPEITEKNTIVAEQTNFWLGLYKYSSKLLNSYRYKFFLDIIFNQFNKLKQDEMEKFLFHIIF